jgi:uncharacterized protein YndB with AHSA1/START domain
MPIARRSDFIPGSPADVFKAVVEPDGLLQWHPHFTSMSREDSAPTGVGTVWKVRSARLGEVDLRVLAFDPGALYVAEADTPRMLMTQTFRLTPEGEGTRLEQVGELRAHRPRLAMSLIGRLIVRKSLADNARRLRSHMASTVVVATA